MSQYISSIIHTYGDMEKVKQDAKTIHEIVERQGITFLLDCAAEFTGKAANRLNLNEQDRYHLLKNCVQTYKESLEERV